MEHVKEVMHSTLDTSCVAIVLVFTAQTAALNGNGYAIAN